MEKKFLKIFNRNIPIKDEYTIDEIKKAFLKESCSSGTDREKKLYIRFFTECTNNNDLQELIKFCKTSSTKIKKLYLSFTKVQKIKFGIFWSTRFRVKKEIEEIVSRNNKIYTEIDNFKLYELTPCIAYEMAIRNKEVKFLLEEYYNINEMMVKDSYLFGGKIYSENMFNQFRRYEEYTNLTHEEYVDLMFRKFKTYEMLIEKNYKNFLVSYIDKCTELGISELMVLEEKILDELINHYLVYPTGYLRQIPGADSISLEKITNSKKEKKEKLVTDENVEDNGINIRSAEIIHDEFIQMQRINRGSEKYSVNNIIPNFNRQVNDQNQIRIAINFSLPENEIVEYITRIKKKISPKTPFELLGNKLDKAKDISNIEVIDVNKKKINIDMTKGEKPQNKFADMLYVYDMKNRGFTNVKIIDELNYYTHRTTSISEKTVKKYFLIAKNYIENKKYKELITGKVEKKQ
jgi:hypothetical protein